MIIIKNILKVCFVIIGTIIGAGFASGKEIYTFFCVYGFNGFIGILISNAIIGLVIYSTFSVVLDKNINSYSNFLDYSVGSKKILNYTINNIMNIFLFISFIVMVSGFGAYFSQEFNISAILGSSIIAVLAFITFFKDIDGIVKINTLLIPILIFLVVLLGLKDNLFSFKFNSLPSLSGANWLIKSILYASYNSIVLIPIIINLKDLVTNKSQIKYIIIFTLLVMIVLSCIIFIILQINLSEIQNIDIPVIFIANKFGKLFKYLYGLVVLIAIFTTAISEGYSLLENIAKSKKSYFIISVIICVVAVGFSNIGFSKLLDSLYPFLGYLGLIQIAICFYNFIRD